MTSEDVKTQEVNGRVVEIQLPTGKIENVGFINDQCTVRELKWMCELKFGIPSDLQAFTLGQSSPQLQDWCAIAEVLERRNDTVIKLEVPVWWEKFVCAALKREVENLSRRSQLPMQQITREERSFVALFIGCCLGDENMISRILLLDIKIAPDTNTKAGRTLLHAAAAGGNINCVDILMKSWREFSPELFTARDFNKDMPYDIAQRLGHRAMGELLHRYMNHDKDEEGERCSVESGINSDEEGPQSITLSSAEMSCIDSEDRERLTTESHAISEYAAGLSATARGNASVEILPKAKYVTPERAGGFDNDVIAEPLRASSPQSSDSSSEGTLSAADMTKSCGTLLHRRLGLQHTRLPNFVFSEEEERGSEQELTRLPALQENDLVSRGSRPDSASAHWPRSKRNVARLHSSPHAFDSRSAPTSPQARRAAVKPTFPHSAPNSPELQSRNRRCSEPFGPGLVYSKILNGGATRRNSQQISAFAQPQSRRKSRSICAVTLNDALCDQWLEENEERLERPWNAWIAAKRKDSLQTSAPPLIPERLSPPKGVNSKKLSFDQWLSEKDLEKLRQMYAMLSLENQKDSKHNKQPCKGKSFEEWMEDNLQEMRKQKQREKEGEREQVEEELQRDRRRRVSKQRYERWLKQKDQEALDEEEKQLREEKRQMKLMRKRWEEEDEKRKKRPALRTNSCPMTNSPNINRWRFSSLQDGNAT